MRKTKSLLENAQSKKKCTFYLDAGKSKKLNKLREFGYNKMVTY
jgi:hypothetical protein